MNNFGLLRKLVEGKELTLEEAKSLGKTQDADLRFPFRYLTRNEDIGGGCFGRVLKISGKMNLVVKEPRSKNFTKSIIHGYEIQKKAFEKGLNCPKPEGLFNFYNYSGKAWYMGFVMGYIIDSKAYMGNDIFELINKEIEKFEKKGFNPSSDAGFNNSLINNGKVYLIDFDNWETSP